ncbi:hypothetical protein [Streptomyces sp. CB00072]|nr:hypothetical protein [Streptomyces sp. CB00072]
MLLALLPAADHLLSDGDEESAGQGATIRPSPLLLPELISSDQRSGN